MKYITLTLVTLLFGSVFQLSAQTASGSDNRIAEPISNRDIWFNVTDSGVSKPIRWGLDLAWLSEENVRRGMAFMGAERIDIIRSSFTPTAPLVNGELAADELALLKRRLNVIKLLPEETTVALNCDHSSVDDYFKGNAANWAELIDITTRLHEAEGRIVESVAPFNEPDYSYTGQGTITDFYNIAGILKKNSHFDNIRISGGNTLNCDEALPWYNTLKSNLDEGNTHQLAGSFDSYAKFFQTVRANGHHATNDELHNVMEAMVGVEYGMQTGIWWGTAEHSRGEFVKASDGKRLAYAEHRPNWTAASVYRTPDGKIEAFGGTSERQAAKTTYHFISKDRDVFYDGHGPQREYTMTLPGGTGYQVGQTNAETVVNITWGDDIQPVINGCYTIVNKNSKKVMEVVSGSKSAGTNVAQATNAKKNYQQWNVTPVDIEIGGDFSYYTFNPAHCTLLMDVLNYSLANNGNIIVWDAGYGANQQWFLEYAGDGWFYIRSRHSAKCLEVINSSTSSGGNIVQGEKDGDPNQLWRFIPTTASVEYNAPAAPADLTATANAASVLLEWTANTESDLSGYSIFRADSEEAPYQTLARNITSTSFVDNTVAAGKSYCYAIRAVDKTLNRSEYSNVVVAAASDEKDCIAYLPFNGNLQDSTIQLNHAAPNKEFSYEEAKFGSYSALFDGSTFVQLPTNIVNHKELTLAAWVYSKSTTTEQKLFYFGNDENEYMYVTPRTSTRKLCFGIKMGDLEQSITATVAPVYKWAHVAITIDSVNVSIYIDGELSAQTDAITLRPTDFNPILNYIGRGKSSDVLYKGRVDEFHVFNYALSAEEIASLLNDIPDAIETIETDTEGFSQSFTTSIYDLNGKLVHTEFVPSGNRFEIENCNLPSGIYILKSTCGNEQLIKKVSVK